MSRSFHKIPILGIALCQAVAVLVSIVLVDASPDELEAEGLVYPTLLIMGGIAGVLGLIANRYHILELSLWWLPIQFLMPASAYTFLHFPIPGWIWGGLFVLTVLVYWNSLRGGVPLYLSNSITWQAISELLPHKTPVIFADLGGGIGGTALYLATERPESTFVSIESSPIPHAIANVRRLISGQANLETRYADIWNTDLSSYDVVYAFLSPVPMERLMEKVSKEMRPGSLFISNSFGVPGRPADEILELTDGRSTQLHVWRF